MDGQFFRSRGIERGGLDDAAITSGVLRAVSVSVRRTIPVSSTVVDSILFRDAFGTANMRALFSDHALVQRYIDVEIALAKSDFSRPMVSRVLRTSRSSVPCRTSAFGAISAPLDDQQQDSSQEYHDSC